jgi:hypothetical protein
MYKVLPKNLTVSSKIGKNFEKIEEERRARWDKSRLRLLPSVGPTVRTIIERHASASFLG